MEEPRHPDGSVVDIVDRGKRHITVVEVAEDTCATCGAHAYVYAKMPSGHGVAYCGHHGTEYMHELERQGAEIIDRRWEIGLTFGIEE